MRKFLSILMVIVSLVILASCEGILPGGTHTHDFSGEYKYDDTYHWHVCECGEKMKSAIENNKHKSQANRRPNWLSFRKSQNFFIWIIIKWRISDFCYV